VATAALGATLSATAQNAAFGGTVAALTSGAGRVTPGADLWVPADPGS